MKVKSFISGCAALCAAMSIVSLHPVFADSSTDMVHVLGWVDCSGMPTCKSRTAVKVFDRDGKLADKTEDLSNIDVRGDHEFNSEYGLVKITTPSAEFWVRGNLLDRQFCKVAL